MTFLLVAFLLTVFQQTPERQEPRPNLVVTVNWQRGGGPIRFVTVTLIGHNGKIISNAQVNKSGTYEFSVDNFSEPLTVKIIAPPTEDDPEVNNSVEIPALPKTVQAVELEIQVALRGRAAGKDYNFILHAGGKSQSK